MSDHFDPGKHRDYQRVSDQMHEKAQQESDAPQNHHKRKGGIGKWLLHNGIFFLIVMALWFWLTGQFSK